MFEKCNGLYLKIYHAFVKLELNSIISHVCNINIVYIKFQNIRILFWTTQVYNKPFYKKIEMILSMVISVIQVLSWSSIYLIEH
jgi:hypothetical protein